MSEVPLYSPLQGYIPGLQGALAAGQRRGHINVQRFRGGLVFKAHRLCVSLNSRLASNKGEEEAWSDRDSARVRVQAVVSTEVPRS